MPKEQFQRLKELLGSADFRAFSGNHAAIIHRDAESFGAEVPIPGRTQGEDGVQRLQWLTADRENPFPSPVVNVVDWLKHFEPTNGLQFEPTEFPEICPSGGLRMLQPSLAANLYP
jgi:hypothetical protein